MERRESKFIEMAEQVSSADLFHQILTQQQNKYDLQPYKIEKSQTDHIVKIYQNIENKYLITRELQVDPNNWNENERRLFVWFIICYTYFQEINNLPITEDTWDQLSPLFFHKKPEFLHFQYLNLLKFQKRVAWTQEEDDLLVECVQAEKPGKWNEISKRMFFTSERKIFRTPKHCRQRWLNHLDSNKKRGEWTTAEDHLIFNYVLENGKRWSKIVPLLNETRTQHMIKNRYNSLVSKSKGSKKLKEDEIARKILKQLVKGLEQESNQERPEESEVKAIMVEERADSDMAGNVQNHSTEGSNEGTPSYVPATYPQPINYGLYYDINSLYMMSQYYYSPQLALPEMPHPSTHSQFSLSKQSNFTPYAQRTIV